MAPKIVDLRPSFTRSKRAPDRRALAKAPLGGKKPIPLKTRRRRARFFAGIGILLAVAASMYGIHKSSYVDALRIQDISVRGAFMQNPEEVTAYVQTHLASDKLTFIARDNIFAYPKEELRAGIIRNFPRLKSVRVGRAGIFTTTLIVNVDEREPYATWCTDADVRACFVFDEGGLVYAPAEISRTPRIPQIFFGAVNAENAIGSVFLPGKLEGVRELMERMEAARFHPLQVHVLDDKDYTVDLENGFTIKVSFGQSVDTTVHNLELVALSEALRGRESELEYVDLRFGNRVYYKFKGQVVPEVEGE